MIQPENPELMDDEVLDELAAQQGGSVTARSRAQTARSSRTSPNPMRGRTSPIPASRGRGSPNLLTRGTRGDDMLYGSPGSTLRSSNMSPRGTRRPGEEEGMARQSSGQTGVNPFDSNSRVEMLRFEYLGPEGPEWKGTVPKPGSGYGRSSCAGYEAADPLGPHDLGTLPCCRGGTADAKAV